MAKRGNGENGGTTRRDFMRRAAIAGLGAGAAMTSGLPAIRPAAAAQLEGPLNLFTWGGHIEKSEFDDFFKETGVRVNFTGAAGNAEDLAKLKLGGGSQYDIVGVDALWVPKFYEEGVIEVIDLEKFPQYSDVADQFKQMPVWKVGTLWMAQPWAWSPLVPWYNTAHIKTPPTSLKFLWDPALKGRIVLNDQKEDTIAWMGVATGAKKPYDMTKAELAAAKDALKRLVPNILKFSPQDDEMITLVGNESVWVTIFNAGGGLRIKEASGGKIEAASVLPSEGYIGYFDGDCIVKGAAHKDAAIAWMQHRMQTKYVAQNFQRMRRPLAYKSPLDALKQEGKASLAHDLFYDQPEIISKMVIIGPPPNVGDYIDAFNEAVST